MNFSKEETEQLRRQITDNKELGNVKTRACVIFWN